MSSDSSFVWTDALILLSLIYNHDHGGADINKIISTADAINHMILTREELDGGLGRLRLVGYIEEVGEKYRAIQPVIEAYSRTTTPRRPMIKELEDMQRFLAMQK